MKQKIEEKLYSDYIRKKDNWTCQSCGVQPMKSLLDCAHIFRRGHSATKYDPKNGIALCRECAQYYTDNDGEFQKWMRIRLGEAEYLDLERRSRLIKQYRGDDIKMLRRELRMMIKNLDESWQTFGAR